MRAIDNLAPEQRDTVRAKVRALLDRSEAWRQLPPDERRTIASRLVDVVAFLADPSAGLHDSSGDDAASASPVAAFSSVAPTATALAGSTGARGPAPSPGGGRQPLGSGMPGGARQPSGRGRPGGRGARSGQGTGADFTAGGVEAGVSAFQDMVGAVDFPEFVSGLIEGVFTSIVDSSIRQMEAYGRLLEAVVKSVEEFAADHITPNQARDYLQQRFPDTLTVRVVGDSPRLALSPSADDDALEKIKAALGTTQSVDLDDEASEAELARRAQLEMARLRQQQLATMVLLGINRIVVTDGLINAKVIFDMRASDVATREATASSFDRKDTQRQHGKGAGWFSRSYDHTQERHRTVVQSSVTDESESKAQVRANLTGEVRVNFRSETFPLERMASTGEIASVSERSRK